MPMISLEAIFRTIADQDEQIQELKEQVAVLQSQLENRNKEKLTRELVELVDDYPETLHFPIVESTEIH